MKSVEWEISEGDDIWVVDDDNDVKDKIVLDPGANTWDWVVDVWVESVSPTLSIHQLLWPINWLFQPITNCFTYHRPFWPINHPFWLTNRCLATTSHSNDYGAPILADHYLFQHYLLFLLFLFNSLWNLHSWAVASSNFLPQLCRSKYKGLPDSLMQTLHAWFTRFKCHPG